jgi:hypothetical protein
MVVVAAGMSLEWKMFWLIGVACWDLLQNQVQRQEYKVVDLVMSAVRVVR